MTPTQNLALSVYEALRCTQDNAHSTNAACAFARIESRRASLLGSTDTIDIVDYGAGDPSEGRTLDAAAKGVKRSARVSDITRNSKPPFWGRFMYELCRRAQPAHMLELGACVGISAMYEVSAMRYVGYGRLTTIEGSPSLASVTRDSLSFAGLQASVVEGSFQSVLDSTAQRIAPIDMVFNDGHHDGNAVLDYHARLLPFLTRNAVVVVDDIQWSESMRESWRVLKVHPRTAVSINLEAVGILILGDEWEASMHLSPKDR